MYNVVVITVNNTRMNIKGAIKLCVLCKDSFDYYYTSLLSHFAESII